MKKNNLPFKETKFENFCTRVFSQNLDENELKWHKDNEDRIIIPLRETNWLFQRDNELPEPIIDKIHIKAGEWHRVIKGTGDLELKIIK